MRSETTLQFESRGQSGNIYFVLGRVREIMRQQRRIIEYNDMWEAVQRCESYEEALSIIGEHVRLVDISTGKPYG